MTVRQFNVLLDRLRNPREHQLSMVPQAPYERRRHLDERSGKHIGEHERPRSHGGLRSAVYQVQAFVQAIDARVFRGGAERLVIDIDACRSLYAQHQRRQRKHTGARAHVEHALRHLDLHRLVQRLQTQRRRRVQSRAECRGIGQSQRARLRVDVSRNNLEPADANRAWAQYPDRVRIASHRRRDTDVVDAKRASGVLRGDVVGQQRRHPAVGRGLDVERAELDESIERAGACVVKIYSVRHGMMRRKRIILQKRSIVHFAMDRIGASTIARHLQIAALRYSCLADSILPMGRTRLEAFSDGVLAIIITIMVLELRAPHEVSLSALRPLWGVFLSYVLSFVYIGIYWNNHHHMLHTVHTITGGILWANLHLLFWLSLVPFVTAWMGENHFAPAPTSMYGVVLLMAAIAYWILQRVIIRSQGPESLLRKAIGGDWKGKASPVLNVLGILIAPSEPSLGGAIYALVAIIWLVPDRRIERVLRG
jgi:uncharacterized membrane protein